MPGELVDLFYVRASQISNCAYCLDIRANAARDFLLGQGITKAGTDLVANAVDPHTTPGIPELMRPEISLLQVGAGMDVAGRGYDQFMDEQREAVVAAKRISNTDHKPFLRDAGSDPFKSIQGYRA
ncbi:alkylhydroperoxidase family enzyme [Rhizobium sp. BK529]|uniref:hypothetical protein n=1 Tax=Rhizobium sp. BK529 TaxID=2586983 RepID=UPI00161ABD2C|nr:alkylhydroperoxidase family enzyme [Rhizobium sp. BK529]